MVVTLSHMLAQNTVAKTNDERADTSHIRTLTSRHFYLGYVKYSYM